MSKPIHKSIVTIDFSIRGKRLTVDIDGVLHDISDRVSKGVWNKGGLYKHPKIDWYIRKRLHKVTAAFLKECDPPVIDRANMYQS